MLLYVESLAVVMTVFYKEADPSESYFSERLYFMACFESATRTTGFSEEYGCG